MAVPMQERIYRAAEHQARYLLTLVHPWEKDSDLALITTSRSSEHFVRPNTGMIEGLAFLYRFGPYDEGLVGISRSALFETILLPMMRYSALTHVTGDRVTSDGKRWGDHWQSAHWAQMLGNAAWWIWDDLPEDVRHRVRKLVAHEADRIAAVKPPHRLRHDTKSEENAWNCQILSVAVVLLPNDVRRPKWEHAFRQWALSAHLRPADEHSSEQVDGIAVSEQFTGANILDDYTMENHGFVHPDYMTSFSFSLGCFLHYRLSGRQTPEAILHNVPGVYENLKWFALPDGGFVYPNGQDWGLFRNPIWSYKHLLMAICASDPDAWRLANDSLDTLEKMQQRHKSGEIYGPDESVLPSTRTDMFRYLGHMWLVLASAEGVNDAHQPRLGVHRLDSAKIVLHRTPKTINSFSWGAKIMAMCVANARDRVVSPHQRNGVGHIRIEGQRNPLRVRLREVKVTTTEDSFSADAVVEHGDNLIRQELRVESDPQGRLILCEKLVAVADVATVEIATGLIGILNNRHWVYERGERTVSVDGRHTVVPALSGVTFENQTARNIEADSVLRIQSDRPLHVHYVGATAVSRGRATDRLYVNYLGGKRNWHAGEVISEYQVYMSCK